MEKTIRVVYIPYDSDKQLNIPVTYRKEVTETAKEYIEKCICNVDVSEMEGEYPEWLTTKEFVITATIYKGIGEDAKTWVVYESFKDQNMSFFVSAAYGAIHIRDSWDALHQ